MNRRNWIVTLVVLVVFGLLAIPKLMPDAKSGMNKKGPGGPVLVGTVKVGTGSLSTTLTAAGTLRAEEEVELRTEVPGRVLSIHFNEGQQVARGSLLLKLNDAELKAQLKKVNANLRLKEQTERRNKSLLEKGGISQEAYDLSRTELDATIADKELLEEQIRKTEVRAPFTGKIGLRNISVGSNLPAQALIASLQQTHQLKLDFQVPERYVALVKPGLEIGFTVDGSRSAYKASILAIEPRIDANTRNLLVRARVSNLSQELFPGSFARVNLALNQDNKAVLIPTQAVVPVLKGQKVFVVSGDSVVERRIELGQRRDSVVQVLSGLEKGEEIVVKGVIQLRAGSKIKTAL